MQKLTQRQGEILRFIQRMQQEQGETPTLREIADHFGFRSMNAAQSHVNALVRKGALQKEARLARALRVVSPLARMKKRVCDIPIYGAIPAGFADRQEQTPVGCISVDVGTLGIRPSARTFALRVQGDSMIGRHILDGDVVVCEHGREPRDGDVVAALIDNQSTLKTFMRRKRKPFLRAENPDYPDLIPAEELVIQGVVTTVVRQC